MAILATALRGTGVDWSAALMVARAGRDDGRRDGPPPKRSRARLGQGQARQASVRASLRLSHRMAALHRDARPRRTRRAAARRAHRQGVRRHRRCPGGLLLVSDGGAALAVAASWNWPAANPPAEQLAGCRRLLERSSKAPAASSSSKRCATAGPSASTRRIPVPPGMLDDAPAWAGIPLIHHERLVGHRRARRARIPPPARLGGFRPAAHRRPPGGELSRRSARPGSARRTRSGSTNSTAASPSSCTTSRIWSASCRCVARNAERHADNPEFRADMVATLQALGRQDERAARPALAAFAGARAARSRPQPLRPILAAAIAAKRARPRGPAARRCEPHARWPTPAALEQARRPSRPERDRRQQRRRR